MPDSAAMVDKSDLTKLWKSADVQHPQSAATYTSSSKLTNFRGAKSNSVAVGRTSVPELNTLEVASPQTDCASQVGQFCSDCRLVRCHSDISRIGGAIQ